MDPCIHVVLIIGGSIYGESSLSEYYVLSFHFHCHKKLSTHFVTNVLNIIVQTNEWVCWSNAIEIWNHQILDTNCFVCPKFTSWLFVITNIYRRKLCNLHMNWH